VQLERYVFQANCGDHYVVLMSSALSSSDPHLAMKLKLPVVGIYAQKYVYGRESRTIFDAAK
jgi:hypothetical protein